MRDPRVENLARILVRYSVELKEGDSCAIRGSTAGEPLVAAVYEEALRAGANPIIAMSFNGQSSAYFRNASDAQLDWISPTARWESEECDANIVIGAETNTRELSQIPPERQARRRAATRELMETTLRRSAEGDFRWVYTLFPTAAYASDAEMSLAEFEDFYYGACFVDADDPVDAWRNASEEWKRLASRIEGHEEVHVTAPGTDIRLGIAGRKFIAADGEHNMPDGEFFTAPVEDSVEGEVSFHLPAMVGGREVVGARLRFDSGKVVDASAERGEDYLVSLLDTDEGSRRLGELGIGTNFGIDRGTRDVLLDEKIGGTVHMAVGASYPECGGRNESAVHTDLVCDLRQGGRIEVDGEPFQQDGQFVA
ncbi:MAG: aminopeptidase [Actinobacteria bacterium]|nr:MAG: aminopeptidase [Actinomycetota bacterium]